MRDGEWVDWGERSAAKGGESACRPCPILFIERCLGLRSSPLGESASVFKVLVNNNKDVLP